MRDYAQFRPRFWTQGTGKQLRGDHEARVMALYLMSAPTSNMIGLYYLPLAIVSHELGMTFEGASEVLRRVCDVGFAKYDSESEYVWVVNMAREQVGDEPSKKDNRIAGVRNELKKHTKCPFYDDFVEQYEALFGLTPRPKPASPSGAPPKPLEGGRESGERKRTGTGSRTGREEDARGAVPGVALTVVASDGIADNAQTPPLGADPAVSDPEPGEPEPPKRPVSQAYASEVVDAFEQAYTHGKMPQLFGTLRIQAAEHVRGLAQRYGRTDVRQVAADVCRAAKPGTQGWTFQVSSVDPYAPPAPAERPSGYPRGNPRQARAAPGTCAEDHDYAAPLDEQFAQFSRRTP